MTATKLELWGGVECTVNRVGDQVFDQLAKSGHAQRRSDLQRFAALGLTTLRFPAIWERTVAGGDADWTWLDERLGDARELGLKVIAGFVHHGSGPLGTSLLDPEFPERLAAFARQFAERYPWVEAYTPVNEPLTTARFSGLYGAWYPHAHDAQSCMRMVLTQCRAVALAMQAVRKVRSDAQLIQTEDLGKSFSTPFLAYQAAFENERRWLSLDILAGTVTPEHPLWHYLRFVGLSDQELAQMQASACPPSIVGINHYITSNRFLDERLERYPAHVHGGNGRHRYADVEAVRIGAEQIAGPATLLMEVWQRYQLPIAVTEVHLGCSREEQLRWFHEMWHTGLELRRRGVELRAITAWSLLGSYDWDSLVTTDRGHYESGVFDLRSPAPRPTALAAMIKTLAAGEDYDHPVLDVAGWWHRNDRLLYAPYELGNVQERPVLLPLTPKCSHKRPLLITGAHGLLATAFEFICTRRALPYRVVARRHLELSDVAAVSQVLRDLSPWAVINAAGFSRIDDAERDVEQCRRDNTVAAAVLAQACAQARIPLLTFSSDLVFDGGERQPYQEDSFVCPLNTFGLSKAAAERQVLDACPDALVVRCGPLFGPWDEVNGLTTALRRLARGVCVRYAVDLQMSLSYAPDVVNVSLDLLLDKERGLWHLANGGAVIWPDVLRSAARRYGFDQSHIEEVTFAQLGLPALRPAFTVLSSSRGDMMPPLERALARFYDDCRVAF